MYYLTFFSIFLSVCVSRSSLYENAQSSHISLLTCKRSNVKYYTLSHLTFYSVSVPVCSKPRPCPGPPPPSHVPTVPPNTRQALSSLYCAPVNPDPHTLCPGLGYGPRVGDTTILRRRTLSRSRLVEGANDAAQATHDPKAPNPEPFAPR